MLSYLPRKLVIVTIFEDGVQLQFSQVVAADVGTHQGTHWSCRWFNHCMCVAGDCMCVVSDCMCVVSDCMCVISDCMCVVSDCMCMVSDCMCVAQSEEMCKM